MDILGPVTVAGIYELRRLQIKRCGRLDPWAVLALDCCPNITRNVHMELFFIKNINFVISRQFVLLGIVSLENSNYRMESMQNYLTPEIELLEVVPEGVLCGSHDYDVDMDPEQGYM